MEFLAAFRPRHLVPDLACRTTIAAKFSHKHREPLRHDLLRRRQGPPSRAALHRSPSRTRPPLRPLLLVAPASASSSSSRDSLVPARLHSRPVPSSAVAVELVGVVRMPLQPRAKLPESQVPAHSPPPRQVPPAIARSPSSPSLPSSPLTAPESSAPPCLLLALSTRAPRRPAPLSSSRTAPSAVELCFPCASSLLFVQIEQQQVDARVDCASPASDRQVGSKARLRPPAGLPCQIAWPSAPPRLASLLHQWAEAHG